MEMNDFNATMIVEGQFALAGISEDDDDIEEVYISACQHLIDTGLAWQLQGFFGRACREMISNGLCSAAKEKV
jgi:hypothetical protein